MLQRVYGSVTIETRSIYKFYMIVYLVYVGHNSVELESVHKSLNSCQGGHGWGWHNAIALASVYMVLVGRNLLKMRLGEIVGLNLCTRHPYMGH